MVQTGLLTPERGALDLLDTYQSAEMQRPLARRIFFAKSKRELQRFCLTDERILS